MSESSLRMTKMMMELGALDDVPFVLLDVGASGGIQDHWAVFGKSLSAYGFEPLVEECERLNRTSHSANVKYLPCFVSDGKSDPYSKQVLASRANEKITPFDRSSAVRGEAILNQSSIERINAGRPPLFTDRVISLDEFVSENRILDIDFIKIDTDGSDYEVLLGAEKTFGKFNVLGLALEAGFHPLANLTRSPHLFSDIDVFCRSKGFALYSLTPYQYSRRDLPLKFCYDFPAQTAGGQVVWGDVTYFKYYCRPDTKIKTPIQDSKLVKLACLYEIYGLPDCAAELIVTCRERFDAITQYKTEKLLDALTPPIQGTQYTYKDYNSEFDKNIQQFYGSATKLASLDSEIAQLREQLAYIYNSKSWKWTGPFRWLRRFGNEKDKQ